MYISAPPLRTAPCRYESSPLMGSEYLALVFSDSLGVYLISYIYLPVLAPFPFFSHVGCADQTLIPRQ